MNFKTFSNLVTASPDPVILIEGRRSISPELANSARETAAFLATKFPKLIFRSGNATGSDEAFAAGVLEVAPDRLQIITPNANHKKKQRHPLVRYDSPESLTQEAIENLKAVTIAATPGHKGLMKCYERGGKLGSQAACLLRDTMKVIGHQAPITKPTLALFCIDPADPEAGGTGHTIRVSRAQGIPVVFQGDWAGWK